MRWYLATDKQLETIFNSDNDCPNHLLVGMVEEMMKRNLFDGIIRSLTKSLEWEETKQAAYIGIYQLAKTYKTGKMSFKTAVYGIIQQRINSLLQKKYTKKSFMNEQALINEFPVLQDGMNVEKTVIHKLTLQEKLSLLTNKQKRIIDLYLKGYSLRWIGENIYHQDTSSIRYQFKLALEKMGIADFEIGRGHWKKGA